MNGPAIGSMYELESLWDQPLLEGQHNLAQVLIDFWPERIGRALDVGCGDGKISSYVTEQTGALIFGIDASEEAIARTQILGQLGDATALAFADKSYPLVLCTDMLEHLDDVSETRAWGELFRVAKDFVFAAVPFNEELLDGTTKCHECGHVYHVNWHQRSYSVARARAIAHMPPEFELLQTVLCGEAWINYHPIETAYRRNVMGEYAGSSESLCPQCSAPSQPAQQIAELSPEQEALMAAMIYPAINAQRLARNHTEILCIFRRIGSNVALPQPRAHVYSSITHAAHLQLVERIPQSNLAPYPQSAQFVMGAEGGYVCQFPFYGQSDSISITWNDVVDSSPVHITIEDGFKRLAEMMLTPIAGQTTTHIFYTSTITQASLKQTLEVEWNNNETRDNCLLNISHLTTVAHSMSMPVKLGQVTEQAMAEVALSPEQIRVMEGADIKPLRYGVIVRTPATTSIAAITLGQGPQGLWLEPSHENGDYYVMEDGPVPLMIQVMHPQWVDRDAVFSKVAA